MNKRFIEDYTLSVEEWEVGEETTQMVSVYNKEGHYVGTLKDAEFLLVERGLTKLQPVDKESKVCQIGLDVRECKWYGWSHRAMFGFGVGDRITKDSAGFKPSSKEEFIEKEINFWSDEYKTVTAENVTDEGFDLVYHYNDDVPNEELKNKTHSSYVCFPKEWGKGEWTALTLEEAKQMAKDFAEEV